MIERFVLFGASGDLAARLLLPSLAGLVAEGAVPAGLRVVGAGTEDMPSGEFRGRIQTALELHAAAVDEAARDKLVKSLEYVTADVTNPDDVARVLRTGSG
ncbi:MAG: glucose-6-phosphate dehydrogenase, partial [Acidimicrobiia bacterium]